MINFFASKVQKFTQFLSFCGLSALKVFKICEPKSDIIYSHTNVGYLILGAQLESSQPSLLYILPCGHMVLCPLVIVK